MLYVLRRKDPAKSKVYNHQVIVMKLKYFIFCLAITIHYQSFSQDWPKVFSNAYAGWFIESYDKGFFIIGPKNTYLYSWIIKTDINGSVLWDKKVGNGQYQSILGGIDQSVDGGFVVTGQSNKYDTWGDPVIMKFSACGELDWCSVINTIGIGDYAIQVRTTTDNCYLLLAIYSDPNPFNRIQLFKFDQTGELIWRQNYPPDSLMFAENSKNILIDSLFYIISAKCYYPDPGMPGGYERPYYIKTDTAGNVIWRLVYGSGNGFHGVPHYKPIRNQTGFIYDAAIHSNFCDTPALFKFSEEGEESYYQDLYPEACPGHYGSVNLLNDTTIVIHLGGTVSGNNYYKWVKTDTLGIEQQAKYYIEDWMRASSYAIITSDQKIASLSSNLSSTFYFYKINSDLELDSIYIIPIAYDSLCPYPIISDTVDPDCDLIVSIQDPEQQPEAYQLKVYPNPTANTITVEIPELLQKQSGPAGFQATTVYHQWGSATLEVYGLFGKKQLEYIVQQGQPPVEIDVSQWERGMYVFRLVFRGETVAAEKVVVE